MTGRSTWSKADHPRHRLAIVEPPGGRNGLAACACPGLALLLASCSALFDFRVVQCQRDDECRDLEGTGESLVCVDALCQPQCEANADCPQHNRPHLCVKQRCRRLLRDVCPEWLPGGEGPLADDTLLLGAFTDLASRPNTARLNYGLALHELNLRDERSDSLPLGRPIALLVCDQSDKSYQAALAHLAGDLGVPAVIAGFQDITQLRERFLFQLESHNLFFLAPAESVTFESTPDAYRDQLWYLGGHPSDYAKTYAALLRIEAASLEQKTGRRQLRVYALVDDKDEYGQALKSGLTDELAQGEKPSYFDPDDDDLIARLSNPLPDVLLVISGWGATAVLDGLSKADAGDPWSEPDRGPLVVLSPRQATSDALRAFVERDHEARSRRVVGVDWTVPQTSKLRRSYVKALQRYASVNGIDLSSEHAEHSENHYDAVYYLAYAALAAPREAERMDGTWLAQGFKRLIEQPGEMARQHIEVGPEGVKLAARLLAMEGLDVTFRGTLGPARFTDARTREIDSGLFCYEEDAMEGRTVVRRQAAVYDPAQDEWRAEDFCFPGWLP
ncbi:MAG: hypothetical protein OXR73_07075 [Myxococcales bacterium]|nr:hypothetical protein [Myxococcales bacterium]